jgi:hypothetical protein
MTACADCAGLRAPPDDTTLDAPHEFVRLTNDERCSLRTVRCCGTVAAGDRA